MRAIGLGASSLVYDPCVSSAHTPRLLSPLTPRAAATQLLLRGAAARRLREVGFARVDHPAGEDFYASDVRARPFDCSSPTRPYSGDHFARCFARAVASARPFALLCPRFVEEKDWFRALFARAPPRPLCVCPLERRVFEVVPLGDEAEARARAPPPPPSSLPLQVRVRGARGRARAPRARRRGRPHRALRVLLVRARRRAAAGGPRAAARARGARGAAGWVVGLTARGAARKAAIARERRDGGGGAKRRARPAAEQRTAGHAPSQRRKVHKARAVRRGGRAPRPEVARVYRARRATPLARLAASLIRDRYGGVLPDHRRTRRRPRRKRARASRPRAPLLSPARCAGSPDNAPRPLSRRRARGPARAPTPRPVPPPPPFPHPS